MAGPFKLPDPPTNFDGAQWAPHVFPPFPVRVANVRPAVEEIQEVLKEEAPAPAPVAESAPPPEAPAPVRLPAPRPSHARRLPCARDLPVPRT